MKKGLPAFKLPSWAIAASAFILVLLSRQILPQEYSNLMPKVIVAFVTFEPEKFSELAAEPNIIEAVFRLVILILMLLILFIPIVIIHFRFKRMLFNYAEQLHEINFKKATTIYIWEQKLSYAGSLYDIESHLFSSLGSPIVGEYPLDLALIIIAYVYYALGPGLLICIIAVQVYNTFIGKVLFFAGIINIIIGVSSVATAIYYINQRSKLQNRN